MTEAEIKAQLSKAARRCWPNAAKASDLPFPDYWKSATDWLAFHAPHIGDKLIGQFIADIVRAAKEAEKRAETPASPRISDEVREIWNRAVEHRSKTLKAGTTRAEAAEADSSADTIWRNSMFLVGWGARSAHGIYPEATSAGIKIEQLVSQFVDFDGKRLKMGLQEMNWDAGLNIRDFRYCGRVANINLKSDPMDANTPDVSILLRRLVSRVRTTGATQRLYMSKLAFEHVALQFERKTQGNAVKYADLQQKKDGSLLGVPVSVCDCMNVNEREVKAA